MTKKDSLLIYCTINICKLKNVGPYNGEKVISGQDFFPINATLALDRRPEKFMIIFYDCSFILHQVVELDTRNTI